MTNLKDRDGYESLLIHWDMGTFSSMPGIFSSREEIESRLEQLLQEREKVVSLVKGLAERKED
jgi:hypothetical protein